MDDAECGFWPALLPPADVTGPPVRSGSGGTQQLRVADRSRAEALADSLAAFGFPLVFAHPDADGWWTVVVCDPGLFPPGTAGSRARKAAYRHAVALARQHGGHGGFRTSRRADRVPTSAPADAPIVRSNPDSRPAVAIVPMLPAPPARALALTPDVYRPGPVDLGSLDAVAWEERRAPNLVRQLVSADDREWNELLWADLMGLIVHQGTRYPTTPAMVPVLTDLAMSTSLPARRRLDLHLALLAIADQEAADLIRDADRAVADVRPARAQHWAVQARAAVGAATPVLLSRWSQQPPAIQFALAVFAALFPDHGASLSGELDAFAARFDGTRPGAYLQLAGALRRGDKLDAVRCAREIIGWHDDADPAWLDAPDLPVAVTCGRLLVRGTTLAWSPPTR